MKRKDSLKRIKAYEERIRQEKVNMQLLERIDFLTQELSEIKSCVKYLHGVYTITPKKTTKRPYSEVREERMQKLLVEFNKPKRPRK